MHAPAKRRRGRPANASTDGALRKTLNKGDGRVIHQLWSAADRGKKLPTATVTFRKNKDRKPGRPSKLSPPHYAYLKRLKGSFANSTQMGQDIWNELERQASEALPTSRDLDQRVLNALNDARFCDRCLQGSPEDHGVTFMGARPTLKPGEHYSGLEFRLFVAICKAPTALDSENRKRRLLRAMCKRIAKQVGLAADILRSVYESQKWTDERRRAQAFLDLASRRRRRKTVH